MSFSFDLTGPADAVRARLKNEVHCPASVREFVLWGVNGLKARHGAAVEVIAKGHGHLCDDGQSYDVSEAHIVVERYVAPIEAVPEPVPAPATPTEAQAQAADLAAADAAEMAVQDAEEAKA